MEGESLRKEQKIVVAVDESEESMHALSWCLSNLVSQNSNSRLVLLYVKPPPPVYTSFDVADVIAAMEKYGADCWKEKSWEDFTKEELETIYQMSSIHKMRTYIVMKRAEAVYRNFNNEVKLESVVGSGEAKDVICNTVEKIGADTLVMGSHGYGFLKRAFLGSVSDHCAKNAKCPVVIVKQRGEK